MPQITLDTHSFRIGGATAAFAAGVPESAIQLLGRWSSDAYRAYLRIPDCTIRSASIAMSKTWFNPTADLHLSFWKKLEAAEDSKQK